MEGVLKSLLVIGLFRSGTNWCQQLLDDNFELGPRPVGYKHAGEWGGMWNYQAEAGIVWMQKDVIAWIESVLRNGYDLYDCYDVTPTTDPEDETLLMNYRYDEEGPDDHPTPVHCSLRKLVRTYHDHWKFWQGEVDSWPGGGLRVNHFTWARWPTGLLEVVEHKFGVKRKWPAKIPSVVAKSGPYVHERRPVLTDEQVIKVGRWLVTS